METRVLLGEQFVCCVPVHKSLLSVRSLCAQLLVVQRPGGHELRRRADSVGGLRVSPESAKDSGLGRL